MSSIANDHNLTGFEERERIMLHERLKRLGNIRWGLGAMVLGLPLPFIILAFLFGGCR